MSLTQFMSMSLPVVGVTPGGGSGTSWGPLLTQSLQLVDVHDHSPGKGAPLLMTSGSFKVGTDLGFFGHSLFNVANINAIGQITALGLTGSLTQCILSASFSGSFASGSWTGGVPYSGSFVTTGSFTPLSLYSSSLGAAFVGIGGVTVLTNSFGQVLISASVGDDRFASYLLVNPDAENPNYRTIAVQTSGSSAALVAVDGGSQGAYTISIKEWDPWNDTGNNFVYTTSSVGSNAFTGSLTKTFQGNPYIIAIGGVSVLTNSLGQVQISGSLPQVSNISGSGGLAVTNVGSLYNIVDFDVFNDKGNTAVATASISHDTQGRTVSQIGSDVYFFVSGTVGLPLGTPGRQVAVFGGNVINSGSLHTLAGLSVDGLGASLISRGADNYLWVSGTIGAPAGTGKLAVFGGDVVVSGSISSSVGVLFTPATASNWNPVPTTTAQALNQLAAPNTTSSLAPAQTSVVIASASIAPGFAKAKSGVVFLSGMLVVNPTLVASGTAQFYRDSTPIGPQMVLPLAPQLPRDFAFGWVDTLPDTAAHAYSFQVSASVGTLSVTANQGSIAVRELN